MLARLFFLFLVTPTVELILLFKVGEVIGSWPTVALIIATGVAGSYLARREGLSAWQRLNQSIARGGLPGKELLDGVIILVSGALLITPGVLTDVVGFTGLLPPTRALIRKIIMKRVKQKMEDGSLNMQFGFFGGPFSGADAESSDPFSPKEKSSPPSNGVESEEGAGRAPESESGTEVPREREARWEGSRRQRPGHVDEPSESSS